MHNMVISYFNVYVIIDVDVTRDASDGAVTCL